METEAISKAESGLTYGEKIAVYLLWYANGCQLVVIF
jgi:hypothetical protein